MMEFENSLTLPEISSIEFDESSLFGPMFENLPELPENLSPSMLKFENLLALPEISSLDFENLLPLTDISSLEFND